MTATKLTLSTQSKITYADLPELVSILINVVFIVMLMEMSQYCIQEFEVHERANRQDPYYKYTKFINKPFFKAFNGMILHVIDTHSDTRSGSLQWSASPGSLECCRPRVVCIYIFIVFLFQLIVFLSFLSFSFYSFLIPLQRVPSTCLRQITLRTKIESQLSLHVVGLSIIGMLGQIQLNW